MRNLLRELPETVDPYELLVVLESRYGLPGIHQRKHIVYPSALAYALRRTWKRGEFRRTEPGPAFTDADWALTKEAVQEWLIDSPGTSIRATIARSFPRVLVEGVDLGALRLLPASVDAAKPAVLYAEHPFEIEFAVRLSRADRITTLRYRRAVSEWAWILNALLTSSVTVDSPRHRQAWVACRHQDAPIHSHWAHELYVYPLNFRAQRKHFSELAPSRTRVLSEAAYYDGEVRPDENVDELYTPDSLPADIARVVALPPIFRRHFIRAAGWIYAANDLLDYSFSAYFIALISAVEALSGGTIGTQAKFREFVDGVLGASSPPDLERLYQLRSQLAHGHRLFEIDEAPWLLGLSPSSLTDDSEIRGLSNVLRKIVRAWLKAWSPGTP